MAAQKHALDPRALAAIAYVAWVSTQCVIAVPAEDFHPVALAALSSGDLAALDLNNRLLLFKTNLQPDPFSDRNSSQGLEICRFGSRQQVADMAAADINNEELLFVTSYWADAVRTIIYRVRPQPGSTPEEVVMLPGVFAGIAVDSHEKTAYLVDSLTSDVYALPLGSEARPSARFILTIRNAVQCGPVALDRGSQELLVGDPIGGLMYSVDLKRRKAAAFASKVGEPRAMAVDEVKRILFVVDAANRRVLALSLGDRGSRPAPLVTFWTNKLLREPSGVALAKDGRIWVCDQSTGRIFHVR